MISVKPIKLNAADVARFWSKVDKHGPNDCWEWTEGRNQKGYGQFHDCNNRPYRAHRVAFAVSYGDTELLVLHDCDNPACCNPAHLYAGTHDDNRCDCVDRGRAAVCRGEDNSCAKLTEDDVRAICALRNDGWILREIAKEYGISYGQVGRICRGDNWSHV